MLGVYQSLFLGRRGHSGRRPREQMIGIDLMPNYHFWSAKFHSEPPEWTKGPIFSEKKKRKNTLNSP